MKQFILVLFMLTLTLNMSGQKKLYIYEPKVAEYNQVNLLEGDVVKLCIKDNRIITPGSKVECTFEQLADAIKVSLEKTYNAATFIACDSDIKSSMYVQINIKSYDVSFYAGMWHAQTRYIIKITKGETVKEEDIEQINRNFNTLGFGTAKKLLEKCFTNSILKLTGVINDSSN